MLRELGVVEQRHQADEPDRRGAHRRAPSREARGARTLVHRLGVEGFDSVSPGGRRSIAASYVAASSRRRRGAANDPTTKRRERSQAMTLWQMDAVDGVRLDAGSEGHSHDRYRRTLPLLRVRVRGRARHGAPDLWRRCPCAAIEVTPPVQAR